MARNLKKMKLMQESTFIFIHSCCYPFSSSRVLKVEELIYQYSSYCILCKTFANHDFGFCSISGNLKCTRHSSGFYACGIHLYDSITFRATEVPKLPDCQTTRSTLESEDGTHENNKKPKKSKKKPLWQRIKDEARHYYHGSKLLYLNIKVSSGLFKRTLKGQKLTRREKKLENKLKNKFILQLEMAKFLQNTLETMSVERKGRVSLEALEFFDLFKKVRSRGGTVSTEEILVFCRLFRDEITLGSLPRPQILALCKILAVRPFGTTPYLRYQLELKLRKLKIDDMMIYGEGIDSLNPEELKVACQARGIPVSEETPDTRLREQLRQWLDLSVQWDIPPSLLILSQVLMYPSDSSPEERLAAAVQSLPEEVCTATRADLLNCCGRMDYQTECECIGEELNKVEEERAELAASSQPAEGIGEETGSALTQILCRSMRLEREKLARLKQKMTGYEEKQDENDSMTKSQDITTSREQKGAKKLKIQLNKMIDDLYKILEKLNSEQNDCQAFEGHKIALSECEEALAGMDSLSQSTKAKVLRICQKLDRNHEGAVTCETLAKMSEVISELEGRLSEAEVEEILDLMEEEGLPDRLTKQRDFRPQADKRK